MSEVQNSSEKSGDMVINEKTIEALIVRFIPTSQYFEKRFDHLEDKFDYKFDILNDKFKQLETSQQALKVDMDRRFEQVESSQQALKAEMNRRFEQVDKRFEQVDQRFQQVDAKLDKIIERIDKRIDEGLRENRAQSFRLFTFAMTFSAISMVGMLGRLFNVF
ncbi:hypothetical protein [Desulfonatronum lacustre]|uniref:hypothetical protein n=1 Tax=Desulfonatronum lacustre TaxID=66849 RepID=UPI00048E1CB3|nr:hypothetical protein [Desulfonatronum lacustre]